MADTSETDYLVIGSGLAGLYFALHAAEHGSVTIITKKAPRDANTNYAQGGIAAVLGGDDSFAAHVEDTLRVGEGLCKREVVELCVREAPGHIRRLAELGAEFGRTADGQFELGREGGHSARRIVHAKDLTGAEVERALLAAVMAKGDRIRLLPNHMAVDLLSTAKYGGPSACFGAFVLDRDTNQVETITARATVLASGGSGKVYLYTTNPDVATGDGLAMAYRAGATLANLEFVQFHPTCLYHPRAKSFLLSEALRGEGAVLRTMDGTRFMPRVHRLAELAPRDVVARAIDREMKRRGEPHVLLDIRHVRAARVRKRFPNLVEVLRSFGFDLTREPIPVVPAAHYMCGGVEADLAGRTRVEGLLAIGEVACTGLHGANRLASNSLLEAMVAADHTAREVTQRVREVARVPRAQPWSVRGTRPPLETVLFDHYWDAIRRVMWDLVGIVRTDQRLALAERHLRMLNQEVDQAFNTLRLSPDLIELRNIALVGGLIVRCARERRESRGLHFNLDHPRPVARLARRPTRVRLRVLARRRST